MLASIARFIHYFFAVSLLYATVHAASLLLWGDVAIFIQAFLFTFVPALSVMLFKLRSTSHIEIGVMLLIFCTLILGEIHNFYERFWWWDVPLHVLGGVLVTYFLFELIFHIIGENRNMFVHIPTLCVVLCMSLGVAVLWEVYEFSADMLFNTRMQPSSHDTLVDLLAHYVGAGASLAILSYKQQKISRAFHSSLIQSTH